jgi:transposase-like protein
MKPIPKEIKEKIIELRRKKVAVSEICKRLGI